MRLIDADKFLSQIEDQYMEHDLTRSEYMDLEDRILQQPTVELEREKGEWVPVSERLPEKHDEVLVTARGEVSIAWMYLDEKWRSNDMPEPMFKDIIAWMPLPEPYKEGK